mgnify:FL=1
MKVNEHGYATFSHGSAKRIGQGLLRTKIVASHAMTLGYFSHRVLIRFAQDPNNLLIAVSLLFHLLPAIEEAINSSYCGSKKPGQVTSAIPGLIHQNGTRHRRPSLDA